MLKRKSMAQVFVLLLIASIVLTSCASKAPDLVVGGKQFSEQFIMAEMFKILIEENTNLMVEVKTGLTPKVIDDAIKNTDDIDIYLEYTGTGLINLGMALGGDPNEVYKTVKNAYKEKYNISWMLPFGFNNTYAMVVTKETADRYALKSISDLSKVADQMILGCTHTFTERADGYQGLKDKYNFEFKEVKGMDAAIMYTAAVENNVDVISGFATDGRIPVYDLVKLEDDLSFFPPYEATAIVRGEVLEKYPELEEILNSLAGRIDDNKMAALNAKVDLDKREPSEVAREFLLEEGLIR